MSPPRPTRRCCPPRARGSCRAVTTIPPPASTPRRQPNGSASPPPKWARPPRASPGVPRRDDAPRPISGSASVPTLRILEPGAQTTVQDLGRPGQLRYGIPPSGPIDRASFILGNRLVGNADTAAGLECTVLGPRFEVAAPCAIAITGADMPLTINGAAAPAWATLVLHAGDVVKVGTARSGVRSYVAFSGGIDLPLVLASRSTYLRGRLGGLDGRALREEGAGRVLPAPMPARPHVQPTAIPDLTAAPTIRVVLGPQAERFTEEGIAALLGAAYYMLP